MRNFHFITVCMVICTCATICTTSCDRENPTPSVTKKTELNLLSSKTIDIPAKGGEFVISYEIVNPTDLQLSIVCDAEWIDITDQNITGSIPFKASENSSSETRTSSINVSYGDLSFSVILIQEGTGPEPEILITSETDINVPFTGGDYEITYRIINPDNTSTLDVIPDTDDWINGIITDQEGVVLFHVDENSSSEARQCTLTLTYGNAESSVSINQEKKKSGAYDEEFHATCLDGFYYGDAYSPGAGNYWFFLSDKGLDEDGNALPNGTYFRIDLYAAIAEDPDNARIPVGTYSLDPSPVASCAEGTFSRQNSSYFTTDSNGETVRSRVFDNATLVVSKSGDGYLIELTCTTNEENITRYVYYSGDTILENQAF